jgi:hypothetical protein
MVLQKWILNIVVEFFRVKGQSDEKVCDVRMLADFVIHAGPYSGPSKHVVKEYIVT